MERLADGLIRGKADRFIADDHLEALASSFEPLATGHGIVDQRVQEDANTIVRVGVRPESKDLPAKTGDRATAIRLGLPCRDKCFGDERM